MAAYRAVSTWPVKIGLGEFGKGRTFAFEADAEARADIVSLLDLASLDRFSCEIAVTAWLDGARIAGRYDASLAQVCGITAEPLPVTLSGQFSLRVLPPGSPNAPDPTAEVDVDPESEDPPDMLEDSLLDLTGYAIEHLALDLDPFPRKPGAEFVPPPAEPEASPFAVLAQFKPNDSGR